MMSVDSKEFFEISIGPQPDNTLRARFACVKDFLKRLLTFPFKIGGKVCKTALRLISIVLSAFLVIATLGKSTKARSLFIEKIVNFAKDLADWILLPFALLWWCLRLIFALLFHPTFYFNPL